MDENVKTPWYSFLNGVPAHLDYFQGSMFDKVMSIAEKYPNNVAFDFMGKSTSYKKFIKKTEMCAKALKTIGIREGDCVTISVFVITVFSFSILFSLSFSGCLSLAAFSAYLFFTGLSFDGSWISTRLSRSAFMHTKKLESAMAAAPYIGFMATPYNPMASGMQIML